MAMLNEILGPAARFQQLLTRKFGILGGAPSPQLTPEVTPEFSLHGEPEDRILCSETLGTAQLTCVQVAGKKSNAAISNPAGSNVLVVVESIRASSLAAGSNFYAGVIKAAHFANLPTPGTQTRRETRSQLSGSYPAVSVAIISSDANAASVTEPNLFFEACPVGSTIVYNQPVILAPGFTVQVIEETANQTASFAFAWREVPMAPGEVGPF